ncbi:MAG: ABC transporter ATP-binding protein [Candidatus Riflebacteria bacterium]|nr:ABC transporter ATP-binding protein [Candidatus Riflebacteria bacterium]
MNTQINNENIIDKQAPASSTSGDSPSFSTMPGSPLQTSFGTVPHATETGSHMAPSVCFSNLTKSFGRHRVLDGVSATIPTGQVVGLLGRNGTGKTTLLRMLYGLIAADHGSVSLLGTDATNASAAPELRQKVAFVSEECHLYPWMTGHETSRFLAPLYRNWDQQRFTTLADDLEVPLDRRISAMSKGARRKLMLALAMAPKPQVLLLDEPLAGLDAVVCEQILSTLIRSLADAGQTVLLSSHELALVERVADRILILAQGKFLIDATTDELRHSMRRVIVQLSEAVTTLPTHPLILAAKSRGAELELIVRDASDTNVRSLLTNLQVRTTRIEGLSLRDIFTATTASKEEER